MDLIPNKKYSVVKKIKLHTKPLVEIEIPQTGLFIKQTGSYLMFNGFKIRKQCVVSIKEVVADD